MTLSPSEHSLVTEVLMRGPISRHELGERLDLSAPSLTRLSKRFIEEGVFIEEDAARVAGKSQGRPRRSYDINVAHGHYVGLRVAQTEVYGVLTDMRANVLVTQCLPLPRTDPGTVVNTIVRATELLLSQSDHPSLSGIGVSLGGQVSERRTVLRNPFLGWRDVELAKLVEDRLAVPVSIENDVTALAEGEHLVGTARGEEDFSVITLGTGVGYGLVQHSKVIATADTGLGLGGHIPVDSLGPHCPQGHRGCTAALLSFGGITAQLEPSVQHSLTFDDFMGYVRAGNPLAEAILDNAARALGRLIVMVTNLTMSPRVVLAGEGIEVWRHGQQITEAEVNHYRDPEASPVEIIVDETGLESWARGAAAVAIIDSLDRLG